MPKIFKYEVIYYGYGKDLEASWFFHKREDAEECARRYNQDNEKRGSLSRVKIVSEKEFKNEKH